MKKQRRPGPRGSGQQPGIPQRLTQRGLIRFGQLGQRQADTPVDPAHGIQRPFHRNRVGFTEQQLVQWCHLCIQCFGLRGISRQCGRTDPVHLPRGHIGRDRNVALRPQANQLPGRGIITGKHIQAARQPVNQRLAALQVAGGVLDGDDVVHISQAQSQSITFLDRFWESKRLDDIYKATDKLTYSPLAAMFRAGYVELSKVKKKGEGEAGTMHDKMDGLENIERALARAKVSETTKLENLLPFLATVGSAAPFVGLFGTVWGIMEAFSAIAASGQADLATVSGPIAEALIATAVSLASAIPAVVSYNYFNRRLKVLGAEMQTFANDYLNIVKRHFF